MQNIFKEHLKELIEINDEEYASINTYFQAMKFRKRQFVIQEHQFVDSIYFVMKGLIKSSFIDEAGKEHILQFASENWWTSDFAAFYKKEKSTIALECVEESELMAIRFADLDQLCIAFPKMEHFFRLKSNFGYVALQKRILSLMADSAKGRYESFCAQYPHLIQRLPKQLIANYLGLSRETLSRLQL
ncbi:Crp/Fnr family transcriptional regulator [Sphingobacterium corticis]|uniref:Crp/Fnr family transcriptional regulator n=1 Tax=Sphingobacterium corticis TaxID=1812823 RepID=A0ABW5NKJ3_9SPHI